MTIMPKTPLKMTRFCVGALYAVVDRWDRRHSVTHPDDYRVSDLSSALWRVLAALQVLIDNEFDPHRKRAYVASKLPVQRGGEQPNDPYTNELLRGAHVPVRTVES